MKIYQSRSFEKKIKKFNKAEKQVLDLEIKQLVQNPAIGTEKKGDLRGIFVHTFKLQNQVHLIAYRFITNECLELIMIGPHENYYRDLKSYIKNS